VENPPKLISYLRVKLEKMVDLHLGFTQLFDHNRPSNWHLDDALKVITQQCDTVTWSQLFMQRIYL
jgi:hypothetical protein